MPHKFSSIFEIQKIPQHYSSIQAAGRQQLMCGDGSNCGNENFEVNGGGAREITLVHECIRLCEFESE